MPSSMTIRIADVSVRAFSVQETLLLEAGYPDVRFLVDDPSPDFEFGVRVEDVQDVSAAPLVFRGRDVWQLRRTPEGAALLFGNDSPRDVHDRLLFIPDDGACGSLTVAPDCRCLKTDPDGHTRVNPFMFPATELVLYWRLAESGGVFFHGSGLAFRGRGCLLCGPSGAGKSTLTGILTRAGAQVLNDDRVGMSRADGDFVLHGTPWHGTALYHRPARSCLGAVFFIEHGLQNQTTRLGPADACARLLAAACPPHFSHALMERVAEACHDVAMGMPCFSLKFLPDASVVETIDHVLGQGEAS